MTLLPLVAITPAVSAHSRLLYRSIGLFNMGPLGPECYSILSTNKQRLTLAPTRVGSGPGSVKSWSCLSSPLFIFLNT